jgi:hypothetical protein
MSSAVRTIYEVNFEDFNVHPQILPDFEEIVNNQPSAFLERQYRNMYVLQEDIDRVRNNKGEHCFAPVSGSGYCTWYFYHTIDDRLVFIIETWVNHQKHWTWQYGVPPERELRADIFLDDIVLDCDNLVVEDLEDLDIQGPPQLIRSCTRFDCHCAEGARRACSTYSTCIGCYKEFENCNCD